MTGFASTDEHKAKKIERNLNNLSAEGWEFVSLNSVMLLGFDIGFYLVLKRMSQKGAANHW